MDLGRPMPSLMYYWEPLFHGEYLVIVHELQNFVHDSEPTYTLSDPFPLNIKNKPGLKSWGLVRQRMETLPPCQTVRKPGLYSIWDGDWIGPGVYTPEGSLRSGWFFLPSRLMNLKIELYSDEDLTSIPERKSIYVIGSSKERGIFYL